MKTGGGAGDTDNSLITEWRCACCVMSLLSAPSEGTRQNIGPVPVSYLFSMIQFELTNKSGIYVQPSFSSMLSRNQTRHYEAQTHPLCWKEVNDYQIWFTPLLHSFTLILLVCTINSLNHIFSLITSYIIPKPVFLLVQSQISIQGLVGLNTCAKLLKSQRC